MTLDPVIVALVVSITLGVCNLIVAPFVGGLIRNVRALEVKQIADDAARKAEASCLRYDLLKAQMDMQSHGQNHYAARADIVEVKAQISQVMGVLRQIASRMHVDVSLPDPS